MSLFFPAVAREKSRKTYPGASFRPIIATELQDPSGLSQYYERPLLQLRRS